MIFKDLCFICKKPMEMNKFHMKGEFYTGKGTYLSTFFLCKKCVEERIK